MHPVRATQWLNSRPRAAQGHHVVGVVEQLRIHPHLGQDLDRVRAEASEKLGNHRRDPDPDGRRSAPATRGFLRAHARYASSA